MDDAFEWDADKARANLAMHKVPFEWAREIFTGPTLNIVDARQDYGETRIISIGEVEGRCLVVVHTPRSGRIRIISARKANQREQKRYYKDIQGER